MPKKITTQERLVAENEDLSMQLGEAKDALRAIRSGEVDGLMVSSGGSERLFTLKGTDYAYRLLIEDMSEGALTLTAEGVILYANRRLAEMLKTPLEKVIGSTIYTWIAPDSQPILQPLLKPGENEKRRAQLALTASDGTLVPVNLSVSTLLRDEMPDSFCLVATDLTEQKHSDAIAASEKLARELLAASNQSRLALLSVIEDQKQVEKALRESEERYRRLAETLPDGVIVHSQGRVVFANPASAKIIGAASPAELIGKPVIEFVHPDSRELALKRIQQAIAEGVSAPLVEEKFIRLDGTVMDVDVVAIPFSYAGELAMLTVFNDITQRKQAEAALLQSEEKFRNTVEQSSDGFLISDEQGRIIEWNNSQEAIFGMPREKMVGTMLWEFLYSTLPEDRKNEESYQRIKHSVLNAAQLEKSAWMGQANETQVVTANGEVKDVQVTAFSISTQQGQLYASLTRDITERKRAEEILKSYSEHLEREVGQRTHELHETQEKLVRQERLAVLGQVAGSIGHELRNPLGVISNAIYFLKLVQPDADEKVKEYLDLIANETRTADKIITDLLNFARIKSVNQEMLDIPELVRQTLARFPALPPVEVILEIPPDLPNIYADPQQIIQVLGNLITNACQAMPEGGKLDISATLQENMISIAIQDTGPGITPENMEKIFEPLFTTKIKGIGLGLAVSKKLVEANGGRIEVQSDVGKGSTFIVYLPVNQ